MYTYMIIDDEPLTRKGTIKKLASMPNLKCISQASDGKEALQILTSLQLNLPDIIITDMNMPFMDGPNFLQHLLQKFPNRQIIIISGYKDFEYTKQAINANAVDYLLKPFSKEDIKNAVQRALERIDKNQALEEQLISDQEEKEILRFKNDINLLSSMLLTPPSKPVALSSRRLSFAGSNHKIILIGIYSPNNFSDTMEPISSPYFTERNLILSLTFDEHSPLHFYLIFIPEGFESVLKTSVRDFVQAFQETAIYNRQTFNIGFSKVHSSINSLNKAYHEVITHLDAHPLSFFYDSSQNLDIEASLIPLEIKWSYRFELIARIEIGDKEASEELSNQLFDFLITNKNLRLLDLKLYCSTLADDLRALFSSYFKNISSSPTNSSVQTVLKNLYTFDEIRHYMTRYMLNLALMMEQSQTYSSNKNYIEAIKLYINHNYTKHLTVDLIASLFYLNRSYCSHMFKQQVGTNLADYINTLRIEKAKELLCQNQLPMYRIAKTVGYDNVKYFFRIFKKNVGCTPKHYQKDKADTTRI